MDLSPNNNYTIVTSGSYEGLAHSMTMVIGLGWLPTGGLVISGGCKANPLYHQAIYKPAYMSNYHYFVEARKAYHNSIKYRLSGLLMLLAPYGIVVWKSRTSEMFIPITILVALTTSLVLASLLGAYWNYRDKVDQLRRKQY